MHTTGNHLINLLKLYIKYTYLGRNNKDNLAVHKLNHRHTI